LYRKFSRKFISVDLTLAEPNEEFAPGMKSKRIEGLATDVTIEKAGLPVLNSCKITINNMKQDDVVKISTTDPRKLIYPKKNAVSVMAWEEGGVPGLVYRGEVDQAYGVYDSPDLSVHIEARTGSYGVIMPLAPYTNEGAIDGLKLIESAAAEMEYSFENPNGLSPIMISDPVVNGSPVDKIRWLGNALGIQAIIEDGKVTVLLWDDPLPGKPLEVSADTGMIGYPVVSMGKIQLNHIWRPEFKLGGLIDVRSIVPNATGKWKINRISQKLQSFGAGNSWDSVIEGIICDG
jgi:hypothetical protein